MSEYILEMKNISKIFPGVKALDDVNLKVKKVRSTRLSVKMVLENPH